MYLQARFGKLDKFERVFVSDNQSAKLCESSNCSFDDPSARVSKPLAILTRGAFAILSIPIIIEQKVFSLPAQPGFHHCRKTCPQSTVLAPLGNRLELRFSFRVWPKLFWPVRGVGEIFSRAINHHRLLFTFFTLFFGVFTTFCGTLPSVNSLSPVIGQCSFSSSRNACHL
jgi:hypothetical protein